MSEPRAAPPVSGAQIIVESLYAPVDSHLAEHVVHGLPTRPEGRAPVRRTRPQFHGGSQLHPPAATLAAAGLNGRRQGWSGGGL